MGAPCGRIESLKGKAVTGEEIRNRYLAELRMLYRKIRKLESLYPGPAFPSASPDQWRAAIVMVARRVHELQAEDLARTLGSWLILRNLVAVQMGVQSADDQGGASFGHRVLDIRWD